MVLPFLGEDYEYLLSINGCESFLKVQGVHWTQRWPRLFRQVSGENKVESLHGYSANLMTGPA